MDENLAWKIVYIAAIFSLVVMVVAYILISPKDSPYFTEEKMEKIAEFKNTRVVGRKKGDKIWEFFAGEGWTSPNRETTYLYDVKNGQIFSDQKPVITDLTAPRAKAYRDSNIVEVFGFPTDKNKGQSLLRAKLNLGRISGSSKQSQWTKLQADFLKYVPGDKQTEIRGNIKLVQSDLAIYSQAIKVDHDKKIADIKDQIRLKRTDGSMTAASLYYDYNRGEKFRAESEVELKITEGIATTIRSSRAFFSSDSREDIKFAGSLEAVQGKKIAVARDGVYSPTKNELLMTGNALAVFEKARVILKQDTAAKLRSPEAREILKEKTVMAAKEMVFSTETGDASAKGSVVVTLKDREARADQAVYDDKNETMTLTGNVHMKKKNRWVSAKKIVISVRDETFEAFGAAEAQFNL